jgi:hypothetical protein
MSERHPNCVLVCQDRPTAAALAEWLTGKGHPAEVFDAGLPGEAGDALGFSPATVGGYEVRVTDESSVQPARGLLAEHAEALEQLQSARKRREQRTGTTTAVCEECGKSSEWPASAMGTTETCPHCQNYMDIPDPEDDWSGVDFGEPEEAVGGVEEEEKE